MAYPNLTIQYLEDSPELDYLDKKLVIDRLRAASERLQFSHLLIGWHVPLPLLEACRMEAERLGMRFMCWQPLLTPDRMFQPDPQWRVVGMAGQKVAGYRGLPEFSFICPNRPAVQDAVIKHIDDLVHQGLYQGFFLDRLRFPSPSADPIHDLTCFCEHCRLKAAEYDLDLEGIRLEILRSAQQESGRTAVVKTLLSGKPEPEQAEFGSGFSQLLAFRKHSIRDFLANISHILREVHLEIGLDCYSPSLTHMVGQDLQAMNELVDWIKLMTYAHTLGPAGIPFELSGFIRYLTSTTHLSERQVLELMGQSTGLPLPTSLEILEKDGLSGLALEKEVRLGVEACSVPALAGLELVELEGVTLQNPDRIQAGLDGIKRAKPAGIAISWDLLHIPLDSLELVRRVYFGNK